MKKNNFKIKVGTAADKDTAKLTQLYRKLYEGDEDQKFFKSSAMPSYFKSGSRVFVARDGNEVKGFIWVIYYEHIRNKGVGIIEELYVDDRYRKRGIGKKLVSKAIEYLKKKHILVMLVTTDPHMTRAKKFYKAVGFKISREWFYYSLTK
jgi:ribosomal protein S18 acetylase RimI-like enzyme